MTGTRGKSGPKSQKPTRSKVKTGCRTCKVRRVKCDEGRPSCQRCVSTGRKCDGYGIWGGGGSAHTHHRDGRLALQCNPFPLFADAPGDDEHCYFEWFRCRTAKKLPGPFESGFWESLVLRASFDEPAVLHAALALGSAHKKESLEGDCQGFRHVAPDQEEQFILRHYSRAIRHLQPHFASKSVASTRVTLITCMVFVCLEYLRGRYQTGNEHLRNGIRVIGGLAGAGNILDLEAPMDPADIWLMETFGRLNLQANLLGQGVRFTYNVVQSFDSQPMPVIFTSIRVARKQLDWLQSEIILLTNRWERLNEHSPLKDPPPNLIDLRLRILKELESWERTYTVSRVTLVAQMGAVGNCVYVMLRLYHKMARIMASTCFLPNGETSFDDHTDDFVQIITESIDFHNYTKSIPMDKVFTHRPDISPFTSDKGCIPPLYFTAIKCRVHRIRLQAIRALMVTLSKEGVWDAQLAGAVGGEVMRLEEGGFYKDIPLEDDFAWDQVPTEKDFQSPELPENNRMHSVQVILPNSRQDEAVIVCKRRTETGISDTITRTYDPVLKKWSDGHGKTTLLATAYI